MCLSTCALGYVEVISCAIKQIGDQIDIFVVCLFLFIDLWVCWKAKYFYSSKDNLAQNFCSHKKKSGHSVCISLWLNTYLCLWKVLLNGTACSTLKCPLKSKIVQHKKCCLRLRNYSRLYKMKGLNTYSRNVFSTYVHVYRQGIKKTW